MTDSLASPHPVELRRRPALAPDAVARANRDLVTATPAEVVRWACHQFGRRLVLTASFADTILIDIATEADTDIEVIFLDTGFHFAETLDTVRRAMERYRLDLTVLRPDPAAADVWAAGTAACCAAAGAQMNRCCASRSKRFTRCAGSTAQPSRQPVMQKYFEKLFTSTTSPSRPAALRAGPS